MEIIKDFTEEEFTKEIEIFTNLISDSKTNLYIPSYVKNIFDSYKEDLDDLMQFVNGKKNSETFYLKKIDFIEKDEAGNLFLNKEKFKNELIRLFNKYENYEFLQKEPFKTKEEIIDFYMHVIDDINYSDFNCCCLLKNKTTNEIFNLSIIYYHCFSRNIPLTVFHEFCHSLQYSFDIEGKINYVNLNVKQDQLATLSKEELETKENIALSIKNKKLIFLHNFSMESQANLFAYMALLLKMLHNKESDNFLKLKDYLLFQSSKLNFLQGYFDFPTSNNIFIEMQQNPEKYLKEFINEDNKIDFEKLFLFTREQILERKQNYEKFLLKHENLSVDLYFKNMNIPYEEKIKLEPQYQLLSQIADEDRSAFEYNMYSREKYENTLQRNFTNLVVNVILDIKEKKSNLKFLEDKLTLCQKKFSEQNYERIKGCFETISDKYKEFTIDATIDK